MMVASLVNTDTLLLEDVQTYNLRIPTVSDGINSNIDKARGQGQPQEGGDQDHQGPHGAGGGVVHYIV